MVEIKKEFWKGGGGGVYNNMKSILEFLKAREGIKMFMVLHGYVLESPRGEHLKLNFTNSGFSRTTTGKEKAKAFNVVNKVESHD